MHLSTTNIVYDHDDDDDENADKQSIANKGQDRLTRHEYLQEIRSVWTVFSQSNDKAFNKLYTPSWWHITVMHKRISDVVLLLTCFTLFFEDQEAA